MCDSQYLPPAQQMHGTIYYARNTNNKRFWRRRVTRDETPAGREFYRDFQYRVSGRVLFIYRGYPFFFFWNVLLYKSQATNKRSLSTNRKTKESNYNFHSLRCRGNAFRFPSNGKISPFPDFRQRLQT